MADRLDITLHVCKYVLFDTFSMQEGKLSTMNIKIKWRIKNFPEGGLHPKGMRQSIIEHNSS